jgi:hypothetical protein
MHACANQNERKYCTIKVKTYVFVDLRKQLTRIESPVVVRSPGDYLWVDEALSLSPPPPPRLLCCLLDDSVVLTEERLEEAEAADTEEAAAGRKRHKRRADAPTTDRRTGFLSLTVQILVSKVRKSAKLQYSDKKRLL